jgi:hypothetical protein
MSASHTPRQAYLAWIEDRIEDHKETLNRDELLQLGDEAVRALFASPDGQYPLTEILLRDAVDTLLFHRLGLPSYRQWRRMCQNDTEGRPLESTEAAEAGAADELKGNVA